MFHDVDTTLTALLTDTGAPAELRGATLSFQTPDKDFTVGAATVNLFLFQVEENRELRPGVATLQAVTNPAGFTSVDPPLRVDCTYLLTAWSTQSQELKVGEEHQLLGRAMAWIRRFPVLPQQFLTDSLAATQLHPITLSVAHLSHEETLSHFWSALGIAPRPAFTVTATVDMALGAPEGAPIVPVREIHLLEGGQDGWALRGSVRDAGGAAVAGAVLTVNETGSTAFADTDGQFVFRDLGFGDYTVRVRAAGRPPTPPQIVHYRAGSEVHDIVLAAP